MIKKLIFWLSTLKRINKHNYIFFLHIGEILCLEFMKFDFENENWEVLKEMEGVVI